MSGSISSTPNKIAFDPTALLGQLDEVKQQASTSITQALTTLGVVLSGTNTDSSGKTKLQPPSNLISNVSDMTARIGAAGSSEQFTVPGFQAADHQPDERVE